MISKIVCVISGVGRPGGAERVLTELCSGAAQRGVETVLLTQRPEPPFYPIDARVRRRVADASIDLPLLRPLTRFFKLRSILRQERPDVILSFITKMNLIVLAASAGLCIPVVVSERSDPKLREGSWIGRLRRLLYPKAAGFVFQTEDARSFFPEAIRARGTVIPNPIPAGIRQKTDYAPCGRIVAVGRCVPQKDYPTMIAAFARFRANHPQHVLEIYGGGRWTEGEEQIRLLGLTDAVRLMGVSQQIGEILADAEFYIMSSKHEGMPNALMEAMAAGLPCVSTDCPSGGPAALIRDGENGLLVPVGDAETLAAAMDRLAADGALRQTLGQHAAQVRETFAMERITDEWLVYLERCAGAARNDRIQRPRRCR